MQPKLVVVGGPEEGRTYPLRAETFTIGRQDGNDLQIFEAAVSRRHCEIRCDDDRYELVDLGSAHGCFVNSLPVGRSVLAHSDLIQVGPTALLFLRETPSGSIAAVRSEGLARSTVEKRPEEIAELLRVPSSAGSSARDLELLLKISTSAQQLREPEALGERLLSSLFDVLGAQQGALLSLTAEDTVPRRVATRGEGVWEPSETVLKRVCEEGVALLWDDITHDESLRAADSLRGVEVRSLLAVPLSGRRALHGLLYFQSTVEGAWTEAHLKLAAAAAGVTALAFDTANTFAVLRDENARLRNAGLDHGMVGESPAMQKLASFIARVAVVDSTVLLRGESGTGKELAAHALHRASPRSDGPFVAINCATLSETLLESELFGHERGAFTGAVGRKLGKFEAADAGTLFLDEVGEIPVTLQARLLRALQERKFERLGGTRSIEVDVRVVAATNRDLEAAIREGTFREDLFYRLNVIACVLPPLRERREDIPLLGRHFARLHSERIHSERLKIQSVGIDAPALRALTAYTWPGNIRQLSNAVERALVLGDGEMIRLEDLPDEMLEMIETGTAEVSLGDFQTTLIETKKQLLNRALDEEGGNAAAAARRLGLHPNSFRRLMRQLGLRSQDTDE